MRRCSAAIKSSLRLWLKPTLPRWRWSIACGARWMQMFTAVSSFLATAQAAAAAETAEQAADTAQEAQEQADVQADEEPLVDEAFDEDEIVVTAPRPAEAATELSER